MPTLAREKIAGICLAAALSASPAVAQQPPAPPVPPPPPIIEIPSSGATPGVQQLVDLVPGEVRCGDEAVASVALEAPFPVLVSAPEDAAAAPTRFAFRIDATGRPLDIAEERDEPGVLTGPRLFYSKQDLAPALAVSRFAPGRARTNCRIRYTPRAVPVDGAPAWLAHRYFVSPHPIRPTDRDIFRDMHAPGTNCIEAGTPRLRVRAYPDFEKIPQAPGTWSYAMTTFDIDASGKPVNVRIASSNGNAALERASVESVRESRFAPEARHGCTYPYYRLPAAPLEPPAPPAPPSVEPADANCSGEARWSFMPTLTFPSGFQTRRIEGWALIGYDVAPWGETGNLKVLAAEPAQAFGTQALSIVRRARKAAAQTGLTGCVTLVRFVMPTTPEG